MNTKKLKQLVLDLAIHGKLVPQDPNDEPASELLKRIQADVETHGRASNKSKGKKSAVSSVDLDEVPFEVPSSWCWTTIGSISSNILYGVNESAKEFGRYKLLRITDIQENKVDWNTVPFTDFDETKVCDYLLRKNDILFARTGATVGKSYLVEEDVVNCIYASYLIKVQANTLLNPKYVKRYFESAYYWNQISDNSIGTGQPNVNGTILASLTIPLPPLAEQHRIVAAIEKWFAVIDQLEKNEADLKKSIEQTKKKVLDLAIRGKLVAQNAEDEPAGVLLERIKAANYYICKKEDELFDIPSSWLWTRISDVGTLSRGKGFLKSDFVEDGYPCIHYGQIHMKFGLSTNKELTYIPESIAMKSGIAHPNDVIIAITSEDELCSCKSTAWLGNYDVAVGSHAAILHHNIHPMYVSYFLASKCFYDQKIQYTHGSKVVEIKPADIGSCYIPLPPLAEQKRIVEKIEEVFGVLERIEGMI